MKIVTASEMRAADEATFSELGITSCAVMESAGRAVARLVAEQFCDAARKGVTVVCGSGNNGGDGFVVARALKNLGYPVSVISVKPVEELKGDARGNAESWIRLGGTITVGSSDVKSKPGIFVDALFGTGFRGVLEGQPLKLAQMMNSHPDVPVVAVDIASGVESDSGAVRGEAVRAAATVALQHLKMGHVSFPGTNFAGDVYVAEIGIWSQAPSLSGAKRELLTPDQVAPVVKRFSSLSATAHKGSRGHVLVIGGGEGHYGAPILSGEAALRTGAGLVTVAVPAKAFKRLAPTMRELMTAALPDDGAGNVGEKGKAALEKIFSAPAFSSGKAAVVIGPGLGTGKGARELLRSLLQERKGRWVIDADALNILAEERELLSALSEESVLTPHPGEMARLLSCSPRDIEEQRTDVASNFSRSHRCWLVLKGARTVVSGPDGEVFVNPSAAPVLGTAGSGDVLSGVIGAFLARGIPAGEAAIAAVFCHGRAGETLGQQGPAGIIAGDLIRQVPREMNCLVQSSQALSGERASVTEFFRLALRAAGGMN